MTATGPALEAVFRAESGRVLAGLIGVLRDFDLAEDALQDAIAVALERWPVEGVPHNPAAWLTTAARHKALDRLRRQRLGERKQEELEELEVLTALEREENAEVPHELPDERLRLIFTCCHPALSVEAQVALTLRTLGGLSTAEVARAFLVPEPTLARRLVRAKSKIREARIPYRVPPADLLPERLAAVLAVVYLVFNEGWAASAGETTVRRELCAEAIRLGRVLTALLPEEPEVLGLLSLLLLHDSRREARVGEDGCFVPLEQQDRSVWDPVSIDEGLALLRAAAALRRPGPYQTQAAISAAHVESGPGSTTDWAGILELYDALERMQPTPVVRLNRAVAVAMIHGAKEGLRLLDALAEPLADYQPYHGARADLLHRLGRSTEAASAYRRAIELTGTESERAYLGRRLAQIEG